MDFWGEKEMARATGASISLNSQSKAYHVMRPIVIATMGLIFSYHTQKYMVNSLAKVDDIIWGTANKPAQFLQRFNSNVLVLFQRVQRFIINTAFEQLILRNAMRLHCLP